MEPKPKSMSKFTRTLNDVAQYESDRIMPSFGDMVKGAVISTGLWAAYSIVFLTVPCIWSGEIVLVLILCVLVGFAASRYFAYRRVRARQSHK